jgi:hypothetical protein
MSPHYSIVAINDTLKGAVRHEKATVGLQHIPPTNRQVTGIVPGVSSSFT